MKPLFRTLAAALAAGALLLSLTACSGGGNTAGSGSQNSAVSGSSGSVSAPSGSTGGVASSGQMAPVQELNTEGLTPYTASDLKDGSYSIPVASSSSMFRITDCLLTVADGQMTARMTMGGTGYRFLFAGTAQEAAAAEEDAYIPPEEVDGTHIFTLPVETLNAPVPCAAFSDARELWYDRTLVFQAGGLPLDAFAPGVLTTVASLGLADGTYTVDVTLGGGSGRAGVESPALLTVTDGQATATITWSSSNYDYMKVDGVQYDPVSVEGNSSFEIPVACLDFDLPVIADTVAMSEPHEISYTLRFDSASLAEAA